MIKYLCNMAVNKPVSTLSSGFSLFHTFCPDYRGAFVYSVAVCSLQVLSNDQYLAVNKPVSFCHQVFLFSFFFHTFFSQGEYTAVVELPEGMHEYKFVVDGQWYHKIHEVGG